jgi:hypothetical protein
MPSGETGTPRTTSSRWGRPDERVRPPSPALRRRGRHPAADRTPQRAGRPGDQPGAHRRRSVPPRPARGRVPRLPGPARSQLRLRRATRPQRRLQCVQGLELRWQRALLDRRPDHQRRVLRRGRRLGPGGGPGSGHVGPLQRVPGDYGQPRPGLRHRPHVELDDHADGRAVLLRAFGTLARHGLHADRRRLRHAPAAVAQPTTHHRSGRPRRGVGHGGIDGLPVRGDQGRGPDLVPGCGGVPGHHGPARRRGLPGGRWPGGPVRPDEHGRAGGTGHSGRLGPARHGRPVAPVGAPHVPGRTSVHSAARRAADRSARPPQPDRSGRRRPGRPQHDHGRSGDRQVFRRRPRTDAPPRLTGGPG